MPTPVYPVAIISADRAKFKWGEVVQGVKFYSCSDPQLDILASPVKYTAAFAGSGGGKTCLAPLWVYKQLANYRKTDATSFYRVLVVSPTLPIFEASQLKQHIVSVFDNTVFAGEWNQQKKTYSGPNFEIVCRTADNDPSSLTGGQYNCIVVDEAWSISNPEVWEEIRRRSNILNAPILLVTTPNVNGWIYSEVYQQWLNKDPEYYVRQWATNQNPVKPPEEHAKFLDGELKKLGKARYDRMYGGQFSAVTGLIYDVFADKQQARYPVIVPAARLPSPALRCFIGLDWGWSDPTVILVFVECENGIVYCVEEVYQSNLPLDNLGRLLVALIAKWSIAFGSKWGEVLSTGFFDTVYCDSSRPEARELMQRYGIPIRNKLISDIEAGLAVTDQMFRVGRLKVYSTATNLIREASAYEYNDKGKPRAGQSDHAMDALRYAISSYMNGKQITLLPEADQPSKQVIEEAEADKAIRLGHVQSPDQLRLLADQQQELAWQRWQIQMLNMDND